MSYLAGLCFALSLQANHPPRTRLGRTPPSPGFGHSLNERSYTSPMTPRVTIGMPVYNGAAFLAEAIESVLAQTHPDLELVISDNGSTDDTNAIINAYAAQDARIRASRSENNRGAAWNFNNTVHMARGEYFRWLAADDRLAPTLVEKSVAVLDSSPDVALCFSRFVDVDSDNTILEERRSSKAFDAPDPCLRFKSMSMLHADSTCEEVFGMVRTATLRGTAIIGDYADSDRTLLAELCLYGPFYEIDEPLFFHRQHARRSVREHRGRKGRGVWFNPDNENRLTLPYWRQLQELRAAIQRSPLPWPDKLCCSRELANWVWREKRVLSRDLVQATRELAH